VILAAPPGFRPSHLKAAITEGKHIFTEKPVAVDGPGIRTCLALYEEAKTKGLAIAAGTQRRHQKSYREAIQRIHDGAIGDIVSARCYWNQGSLWNKQRQSDWTDMEWQLRNWLYFTWLSGDHIVEQHVHNLDVVNWATNSHPVRAVGMGGRQVRTSPEFGHIFDHFAVDYEYASGMHLMSMCRQIQGCENKVAETLVGNKGLAELEDRRRYLIKGQADWQFSGKEQDSYLQEHTDLIESIRGSSPINELKNVTESTLTAIMGRMSAYTGKAVTWEQALNSSQELVPTQLSWGKLPVPPVAVPGQTELV
jgi:myo-inositol 2-dehydrogenase / D-chiro-inositol 1-dehydrogenase